MLGYFYLFTSVNIESDYSTVRMRKQSCTLNTHSVRAACQDIENRFGSVNQETSDEEWVAARLKEYEGLLKKQVVEPAKLPTGARKLG